MNNSCRICNDPRRLEADRLIVQGVAIARIAQDLGLPYYSLYTHSREHVARQLVTAVRQKESLENFQLLNRINTIVDRCEALFTSNLEKGRDLLALKALSEQRATFELIARIAATLVAAQQNEAELIRLQNNEVTAEDHEVYQKSLKCLTLEELKLLHALQNKVAEQDSTINVIADFLAEREQNARDFSPYLGPSRTSVRSTEANTLRRTKPAKPTPIPTAKETDREMWKVRPIEPRRIPCSEDGSLDALR